MPRVSEITGLTLKRRDEMTPEELSARTLHLRCRTCGHTYDLPPVCGDTSRADGACYYSSDRDFCKECGSSDVEY